MRAKHLSEQVAVPRHSTVSQADKTATVNQIIRSNVYLHPGQLFASVEPTVVTTLLGSCVSVCLWDSLLKIGGINHFMLPYGIGKPPASLRFGNIAVEYLIEKLLALGSRHSNLQAKLFGGACVLEVFRNKEGHLGLKNAQMARNILQSAGIPIVAEDLGGKQGRKMIFNTDDGAVLVSLIGHN
jgi:chemotaxis protein CheD